MLKIAFWEIKKTSSPKIIISIIVFLACIFGITLIYKPNISSGFVLRDFYSVGFQNVSELREIGKGLESYPSLKVFWTDSPDGMDVYFSYNGEITVYMSGDTKSLIAFSHIKRAVDEISSEYLSSLGKSISEPIVINLVEIGGTLSEVQESSSMPPSEIPEFRPFETTVRIILFILPSILMSSLFGLSIMSEKIGKRIENLLTVPYKPFEILIGKMLPYLAISIAFSALLSIFTSTNFVLMSIVLFFVNLCFFSIASIISIISRSFKEFSFLSTFAYFTFFFLLVFPNVMYGMNSSASLSPLSIINDLMFNIDIDFFSLVFSFLPFVWLTASLILLSSVLFKDEFLTSKKGFLWLLKKAFESLERRRDYPIVVLFIFTPILYFAEIILSILMSLIPVSLGPYIMLFIFALIEECSKQVSIKKRKIYVPLIVGVLFFIFEKSINMYLFFNMFELVSIYSKMLFNVWITLGGHIFTSFILFAFKRHRKIGLLLATLIHAGFNFYIGGLIV